MHGDGVSVTLSFLVDLLKSRYSLDLSAKEQKLLYTAFKMPSDDVQKRIQLKPFELSNETQMFEETFDALKYDLDCLEDKGIVDASGYFGTRARMRQVHLKEKLKPLRSLDYIVTLMASENKLF
jgi:hypothetical protein